MPPLALGYTYAHAKNKTGADYKRLASSNGDANKYYLVACDWLWYNRWPLFLARGGNYASCLFCVSLAQSGLSVLFLLQLISKIT